jgi:hypothetical protein
MNIKRIAMLATPTGAAAALVLALPAGATTPTAATIGQDTAESLRDQFLPVMVAVIPVALTVVAAKRGYRWAKGQAG